jgi:glycosyltransferase involved in cell wall biosynthesis
MIKRRKPSSYDVAFYVPRMGPLLAREARSPTGGAETQILLLARALAERGVKVRLLVFALPGVAIPESLGDVVVSVRPPYQAHKRLGKVRELVSIARAIAAADADLVVSRGATPEVGLAGLLARLTGRRFVYSSANVSDFRDDGPVSAAGAVVPLGGVSTPANPGPVFDFSRFPRSRRDWELFRLGIRLANEVVVQTEEQVNLCKARFGRSPALIRSIAEPAPQRSRGPEAFLWIARLVSYKRPFAFLDLARALPRARFWMVAPREHLDDGELEAAVVREATKLDNLEVLAPRPRPELMELVDRAVAIVNTADFEGMPNIFLEGWSRGIPALALTHDPDQVIERHNLGAFAHGSQERLAELAWRLWEERGDQMDVAARCRRYIADYHSPEAISTRWLEVLGIQSTATAAEAVVAS